MPLPLRIDRWPIADRPRERLLRDGPAVLSDAELLAVVLGTGHASGGATALDLAREVLGERGLPALTEAGAPALVGIPGVGAAKAARVAAALELGRRAGRGRPDRPQLKTPADVVAAAADLLHDADRERLVVLSADTKHRLLGCDVVSIGTLDGSPAHPREVFKSAIRRNAAAIALVHNHPSGDPTPSPEDRAVTRRMHQAGKLLGIPLLDHVVVGDTRYVSLRAEGMID
ncbi:MAG TPA: DNA repair protein RadC [Bacillota bacterium]|nr:DNA repair protein RadC [Bacillota bacterium]